MSMGMRAAGASACLLALLSAGGCAREDELIVEPAPSLPADPPTSTDAGSERQTGSAGGSGMAPPVATRDAAALDGAIDPSDAGVSTLDAAATAMSVACAAEFSACTLANAAASGPCLARYADCEPAFSQPNDAGIDGVCATKFSACVLEDAARFDRCLPMLAGC